MLEKTQDIRHFFFSQYLADGIRITLEIILPSVICAQFGRLDIGINISLGALCVSISDAPGPVKHKFNGMLYCNIFIFLMALLTGFTTNNFLLLGLLVVFSSFFFTMFTIYGNRAASIGTATLLIMILRMADIIEPSKAIAESALILGGGVWYMLLALLFYRLTPYRPAQRALGNCIHETAKYLRIKSALYDTKIEPEGEYRKLVAQQVVVNESQDDVRELLFKNRSLLKESTRSGRLLVLTFADLVDLYEQIMASWYDYTSIRKKFASTGILDEISLIIKNMANNLDDIGYAIQSNWSYKIKFALIPELENLKVKIDASEDKNNSILVLKKVLVNLRNIGEQIDGLSNYFDDRTINRQMRSGLDYSKFVSHQKIDGRLFTNNFTLESSVFRHALRMMVTCGTGYIIGKMLPNGHHSYWLLLTIIVILKPGFSLTKQRNFERFTGTVAGGLIGLLLLAFIHDRTVLFSMIVFFMIGTYTFQRLNYIVMVIFMTPYILILFNLLGLGFVNVAEERLLDTGIASVLAFFASYLLFPHWESNALGNYMSSVLKANINYLLKIADFLCGKPNSILDYKLVRKEVFLSTANLSAAFNRMLSEPKSKQRNSQEIYQFVVLNNVLSSNIASIFSGITGKENEHDRKAALSYVKRSKNNLEETLLKLDSNQVSTNQEIKVHEFTKVERKENNQLTEQLGFVYKLTRKINRITFVIVNKS